MDANSRLSEEVVSKTKSCERLKGEAEKCLAQSERFSHEKTEFESAIYEKFLSVLNSKKAKLRELQDRIAERGNVEKLPKQDEESTNKTGRFGEESEEDETVTSKEALGRKRTSRKQEEVLELT